jgi:hypothetical protein
LFVRGGARQIEVQLVGVDLGEELAAAGEVFEVEELVFFQGVRSAKTGIHSYRA